MRGNQTLFAVEGNRSGFLELMNGIYGGRQDSEDGLDRTKLLQLIRSGPWTPAVSLPFGGSGIVVDDRGRCLLEDLKLSNYTLQPVIKKKIVPVSKEYWKCDHDGDLSIDGRDPGSFLMESSHSEAMSDAVGSFSELVLPCGGYFKHLRSVKDGATIEVSSITGWPMFYGFNRKTRAMKVFVTESGRRLLDHLDGFDERSAKCLQYSTVLVKP